MSCKPTTIASRYSNSIIQTGIRPSLGMFDIISAQENPANAYNADTLLNVSRKLSKALKSSDISSYPLLESRVKQSPILFVEVADFLNQSGLNVDQVNDTLNDYSDTLDQLPQTSDGFTIDPVPAYNVPSDTKTVFSQLEFYYSENIANSISGGLCAAIANPFGKLLGALEALNFAGSLLDSLLSFDLASLLNPLTALKDKLTAIVDSLVDTLKAQVDGLVKSATSIINNIKTGAKRIMKKLKKMVANVKAFFSDDTKTSLKDKIGEFVQKSIDQFKELTPSSIAMLLFRFCQFTEMMQAFMKGPVDGLKSFVVNLGVQEQLVNKMSGYRTQQAANAGAVRIDDEGIKQGKERIIQAHNEPAITQDTTPPPEIPKAEEYVPNAELTPEENDKLANLDDNGIDGYFKFSPSVLNMGANVSDAVRGDGYRKVNSEVWQKLMIVARRMGRTFTINSAYRSPQYNSQIAKASSGSKHLTGLAVDVSMAGFSDDDVRQFIRIASQEGFQGIAYYSRSNFMHIDLGSRRTWFNNHRFAGYIDNHVQDGFRKGHSAPTPPPTIDS